MFDWTRLFVLKINEHHRPVQICRWQIEWMAKVLGVTSSRLWPSSKANSHHKDCHNMCQVLGAPIRISRLPYIVFLSFGLLKKRKRCEYFRTLLSSSSQRWRGSYSRLDWNANESTQVSPRFLPTAKQSRPAIWNTTSLVGFRNTKAICFTENISTCWYFLLRCFRWLIYRSLNRFKSTIADFYCCECCHLICSAVSLVQKNARVTKDKCKSKTVNLNIVSS
jgi:hypothetical protein